MEISRVVFFTEDKNVGKLLRSLVGVAVQQPTVEPVHNAKVKGGGIVAATNGELLSLLVDHLRKAHVKAIVPADLKAFVQQVGRPESAYSTLRTQAQDAGVLKKKGHGASVSYTVSPKIAKMNVNGSKR
jgi:hypothetical protein